MQHTKHTQTHMRVCMHAHTHVPESLHAIPSDSNAPFLLLQLKNSQWHKFGDMLCYAGNIGSSRLVLTFG
jgi:hypothetical protein